MTGDDEVAALLALAAVDGVGPRTLLACHRIGGAESAWRALLRGTIDHVEPLAATIRPHRRAQAVASARRIDPLVELGRCRAEGLHILVEGRPGYPARLRDDPAPPALLFATGPIPEPDRPVVAVVGTRNATALGRSFAGRLGAELTEAGVSVVSGLALGIDGAAHRGAVDAHAAHARSSAPEDPVPGPPVGVIAAGLDIAYPARHQRLHREVAAAGVLVSETPLGCRPTEWRFPARNRIIAGLSDAVVVVESRTAGGSLITVDEAQKRDTTVLAVPGHPTSPAATGTNALLFDGAAVVRDVDDVLGMLSLPLRVPPAPEPAAGPSFAGPALSGHEAAVLDHLDAGPQALGELVSATGLGIDDVAAALTALEIDGRVQSTGGWYEPIAGSTKGARS